MWTTEECMAKAADVERQAGLCASDMARVGLLELARGWRQIALQARRPAEDRILFVD